jgi:hypothetical protein
LKKTVRAPRPCSIGRVIAVRHLRRRGVPGHPVVVRVGIPRKLRGGWDWGCPVEIRGLGEPRLRYVYGVDAFQALQLGMDYIGIRVATSIPQPFQFEAGDGGGFSDSIRKYFPLKTRRKLEALSQQSGARASKQKRRR